MGTSDVMDWNMESITKRDIRVSDEVVKIMKRWNGKEWYRNRTFSIERNYRKARRYDHGNLRQKEKRKHVCDSITICWLNFKWAEILQFCKTSARFLKVK